MTTDRAAAYPRVLDDYALAAPHVVEQYVNNPIEADQGRLKARLHPMRGLNASGPPKRSPSDIPSPGLAKRKMGRVSAVGANRSFGRVCQTRRCRWTAGSSNREEPAPCVRAMPHRDGVSIFADPCQACRTKRARTRLDPCCSIAADDF